VPDLSAVADPATPMAVGLLAFPRHHRPQFYERDLGGTSLATPLVAGLVADAQQGQAAPFGFLNPVLYRLAGTSAFHDVRPMTRHSRARYRGVACASANVVCQSYGGSPALDTFDEQDPNLAGYRGQVTLPGYDNMTGLGTPNGQAFIAALRRLAG
jgi:hypothetical protein